MIVSDLLMLAGSGSQGLDEKGLLGQGDGPVRVIGDPSEESATGRG